MRQDLELLRGAIELHVHSGPDLFPRLMDHVEVARAAKDAGYRAIVIKSQNMGTADRVHFIRMLVPSMEIYGSITLNYSVGGINPFAVNAALGFGAKVVWMPTVDAKHHASYFGGLGQFGSKIKSEKKLPDFYKKVQGLTIFSPDGKLIPEVMDVLDLVASSGVAFSFGHLSLEEDFALAKACRDAGVKKMFIDHPDIAFTKIPRDSQVELAKMGVKMNYVAAQIAPSGQWTTSKEVAANIRAIGVQNALISTDVGQIPNPNPIEMMRSYVAILLNEGFTPAEVKTMLHDNPGAFLYE